MVYQHKGKSYSNYNISTEKAKKLIKRYYIIEFECTKCHKRSRLKELETDFMGRFHCQCSHANFTIVKQRTGDTGLPGENNIVMIESYTRREL